MTDGLTRRIGAIDKKLVWREDAIKNYTGDSDAYIFSLPERDDVSIKVVSDNKGEPLIFSAATFGAGGVYGAVLGTGANGKKNLPLEFTGPNGDYYVKVDLLSQKPSGYNLVIERKSGGLASTPPSAISDFFTVEAQAVGKKGVVLDILSNDEASTGNLNARTVTIVDDPASGDVRVSKGGLVYKPAAGFEGTECTELVLT